MPLSGVRGPCRSVPCGPQPWRVDGKWRGRLTAPGSEVQVTTCPRAPWIYYSICPCARVHSSPHPRGGSSHLASSSACCAPSVHPALFFTACRVAAVQSSTWDLDPWQTLPASALGRVAQEGECWALSQNRWLRCPQAAPPPPGPPSLCLLMTSEQT